MLINLEMNRKPVLIDYTNYKGERAMQNSFKYYTGCGSRTTPKAILSKMEEIALRLCCAGYVLRSGGADGADTAFEKGVDSVINIKGSSLPPPKRIYLPWKEFGNRRDNQAGDVYKIDIKALAAAARIHPAWDRLIPSHKRLHARNIHQVLGDNLKSPSRFLICWTENGQLIGGTRTAIVCAKAYKIPVYNLGDDKYGQLTPKELVEMILEDIGK
jgi:hypothetical protein